MMGNKGVLGDVVMTEEAKLARKRLAQDSNATDQHMGKGTAPMILYDNQAFVTAEETQRMTEQVQPADMLATPQKSANKKKLKGGDGEMISSTGLPNTRVTSAAPREGDRRAQ